MQAVTADVKLAVVDECTSEKYMYAEVYSVYPSPSPRAAGALLCDSHTEARCTASRTRASQVERVGSTPRTLTSFNVRLIITHQIPTLSWLGMNRGGKSEVIPEYRWQQMW